MIKNIIYLYIFFSFLAGMYISESNYSNTMFRLNKFRMENKEKISQMSPSEWARFNDRFNDFQEAIIDKSVLKGIKFGFTFPHLFYQAIRVDISSVEKEKMWNKILMIQKSEVYDYFDILE